MSNEDDILNAHIREQRSIRVGSVKTIMVLIPLSVVTAFSTACNQYSINNE